MGYISLVGPHRNQLKRRAIPGTARFLTFSTFRRLRLFDNDRIKDAFVDALTAAAQTHAADVIAWVVMPEHVHLIVFFDGEDRTTPFLRMLKRPFARKVIDRWRSLDAAVLPRITTASGETKFWQPGGGFDRNVIDKELIEKVAYLHKNPITRGLSRNSVSWRWSSARAYRDLPDAVGPVIAFDRVPRNDVDLT